MVDIKQIRTKLGLSQEAFATKLGVSSRTIQNWESGKPIPGTSLVSIENLVKQSNNQYGNNSKQFNGKIDGVGNVEGNLEVNPCPEDAQQIKDLEKEVENLKGKLAHKNDLIVQLNKNINQMKKNEDNYEHRIAELKEHIADLKERVAELKSNK